MQTVKVKKNKISVVVPTIRENSIQRFIQEWSVLFAKYDIHLIIVEDNPTKTFDISAKGLGFKLSHFSWADIKNDLGKDEWIIPRRTSAIKSYGFYKAYKLKADTIISLDDDCYPLDSYKEGFNQSDFIKNHLDALDATFTENAWFSTMIIKKEIRPRGLPYKNLERTVSNKVMMNHGLWANVPDFDAITQLKFKKFPGIEQYFKNEIVPVGQYFPMCGMNVSWRREMTPLMYFMLMGKDHKEVSWGFDRFDDIWAGLCVKKISDHLNYRVSTGYPAIWHDRASDPYKNLEKERTGMPVNEYLWEHIDSVVLKSQTVAEAYKELAKKLPASTEYILKLKKAMVIWADLFA